MFKRRKNHCSDTGNKKNEKKGFNNLPKQIEHSTSEKKEEPFLNSHVWGSGLCHSEISVAKKGKKQEKALTYKENRDRFVNAIPSERILHGERMQRSEPALWTRLRQILEGVQWSVRRPTLHSVKNIYEPLDLMPEHVNQWFQREDYKTPLRWLSSTDPPKLYSEGVAVGLYATLGTVSETFKFWWKVLQQESRVHGIECVQEHGIGFKDNVRVCQHQRFQPYTIRWVQIRVDMGRRSSVAQARAETTGDLLSGPELLAVAAQHPNFLRTRDGKQRPYLRLGGLGFSDGSIPILRYDARNIRVVMEAHPQEYRDINRQYANAITFPLWGLLR
jgi:hypothetical protein